MTESQSQAQPESSARAAASFTQAFADMHEALLAGSGISTAGSEIRAARLAIEQLSGRVQSQLDEDKEQRRVLGDQLATLAGSLERLVVHLQGLSQLMGDLLERLAEPAPAPRSAEAPFQPGGEGLSLALAGVPGFQALMDIQKALSAVEEVAGASVERYQEGESRILLHLSAPITASAIATALRAATPYTAVIEEAKPELSRLRMKLVQADA